MAYVKGPPILVKKGKTTLKESTSDTRRKRMWTEADERQSSRSPASKQTPSKAKGATATKKQQSRTGNWLKAAALEYGVTQKKIKTALEKLKTN